MFLSHWSDWLLLLLAGAAYLSYRLDPSATDSHLGLYATIVLCLSIMPMDALPERCQNGAGRLSVPLFGVSVLCFGYGLLYPYTNAPGLFLGLGTGGMVVFGALFWSQWRAE